MNYALLHIDARLIALGRKIGKPWVAWARTSTTAFAIILLALSAAAFFVDCAHTLRGTNGGFAFGALLLGTMRVLEVNSLWKGRENSWVCAWMRCPEVRAGFACMGLLELFLVLVSPWFVAGFTLLVLAPYVLLAKIEPEPLAIRREVEA